MYLFNNSIICNTDDVEDFIDCDYAVLSLLTCFISVDRLIDFMCNIIGDRLDFRDDVLLYDNKPVLYGEHMWSLCISGVRPLMGIWVMTFTGNYRYDYVFLKPVIFDLIGGFSLVDKYDKTPELASVLLRLSGENWHPELE